MKVTPSGSPARTATAPSTSPAGTPMPPPAGTIADEAVAFENADGATLHGHLYSVAGPKRRVVIFAHAAGSNQTALKDVARLLVGSGVAVMTFDFAGAGESSGTADVSKWDRDLQLAWGFLKSRDYPLVYLVGAGAGGTAALKTAAHADTAGVVTLSAPVSDQGLDARPDLASIAEPKLFLAARGDSGGSLAAAVDTFLQGAPQPKQSMIIENSDAGGAALLAIETVKKVVADFITSN